jgi:hypothetical protein
MKLTDEGEYVFLELNPMGQFLYVEILTGFPLTAAMAELLAAGRDDVLEPALPSDGASTRHEGWSTLATGR